jgi:dTDP-glucose 4,6-dehydratase
MKILVTGGAGFIGSNFIHMILSDRPGWRIVCLDALAYAGNLENLKSCLENSRLQFVKGDIADPDVVDKVCGVGFDAIINFAAESHVDRSIMGCAEFIRANIQGVQVLLDAARKYSVGRFFQISTDEVYGALGASGKFIEQTPLSPNSPYSASKAAADLLVQAYHHTYKLDTVITRCSNNYGPYQFPEKLIPLFVTNLLTNKKIPVYGDGLNVRDWIHVRDHCAAVLAALEHGKPGEVYNVGSENEHTNLEITALLLELLGKDKSSIEYVPDRLGHDRRYAIDSTKIKTQLQWTPRIDFKSGLAQTIQWYRDNRDWWLSIKSGDYLDYYKKQYGTSL